MSLAEKVWEAFTTVIQMRDKIATLTEAVKGQQAKIESLTERTVRLETTLDLSMKASRQSRLPKD